MTTLAYNGETAIPALAQQRRHQAHHALGTDIDLTLFGSDSDQYLQAACDLIDQYEDRLTVNRTVSGNQPGGGPTPRSSERRHLYTRSASCRTQSTTFWFQCVDWSARETLAHWFY